jgi:hypothetical protein
MGRPPAEGPSPISDSLKTVSQSHVLEFQPHATVADPRCSRVVAPAPTGARGIHTTQHRRRRWSLRRHHAYARHIRGEWQRLGEAHCCTRPAPPSLRVAADRAMHPVHTSAPPLGSLRCQPDGVPFLCALTAMVLCGRRPGRR